MLFIIPERVFLKQKCFQLYGITEVLELGELGVAQKSLSFAQDSLLYNHVCLCSDGGAAAAVPAEGRGAAGISRGAGSGTGMGSG